MECCLAGFRSLFHLPKGHSIPDMVVREDTNKFILVHGNDKNVAESYDVSDNLGEGGFGVVRKVTDKVTGSHRVLKGMLKESIPDVKLFQNEIEFQAECDHPHIAKLYETFEDDTRVFIIMELCEGGEVLDVVERRGHIGELDAWHIFGQLMSALVYMHSKVHLAHRDLKPENLLIKEKGLPLSECTMKLIDFGFAQHFQPGRKSLKTKCGTPYYMAPEVLGDHYDEKCDIWSSGVILYFLLCGEFPFYGEELVDIIASIREGVLNFGEEAWEHVDTSAQYLISEMCSLEPRNRPSALEILNKDWVLREREFFEQTATVRPTRSCSEIAFRMKSYARVNPFKKAALAAIGHCMQDNDIKALKATFEKFDEGDGVIKVKTLKEALQNTGNSQEDLNALTENVAHDGQISYSDFLSANVRRASYLKDAYCLQAFRLFDKDCSGTIDIDEFRAMMEDMNVDIKEAEAAFRQCDRDGDEMVDYQEFMSMMRKPTDVDGFASEGKWSEQDKDSRAPTPCPGVPDDQVS